MALIKCPECKKEISDTVAICPNCGFNIQKMRKQQAKKEKEPKTLEEWNNMTSSQKNWSIVVFVVIVIIVLFILSKLSPNNIEHSDDKCDICKKTAYSSINGEEFCYEHYNDAIDYYLDD